MPLERGPQRKLNLARSAGSNRRYRVHDGRIQVHCIDNAAEPGGVRWVESSLRLT